VRHLVREKGKKPEKFKDNEIKRRVIERNVTLLVIESAGR